MNLPHRLNSIVWVSLHSKTLRVSVFVPQILSFEGAHRERLVFCDQFGEHLHPNRQGGMGSYGHTSRTRHDTYLFSPNPVNSSSSSITCSRPALTGNILVRVVCLLIDVREHCVLRNGLCDYLTYSHGVRNLLRIFCGTSTCWKVQSHITHFGEYEWLSGRQRAVSPTGYLGTSFALFSILAYLHRT